VYSAGKVPNCLVEPFFGDNAKEASLAVEQMDDYAKAILRATREWFDS
jgi:N-acetylmuramoyl-L-alanine amidase